MCKSSFIKYLRYEKRYSKHTIKAYQTDLEQFSSFCGIKQDEEELLHIPPEMIRAWVVDLMEHVSIKTVNRKITCLKSFYRYLQRNEKISVNPMYKVVAPKNQKRIPEFVAQKPMEELVHIFEQLPHDFSHLRDQLMLEFFYNTGVRLSELIHLKHKDLDIENKQVRIFGKRRKERILPISDFLNKMLMEYVSCKKETGFSINSDMPIFVTDVGNKMYVSFVYRKVRKYLEQVTTISKKSPHVLRHTFATHMLNNGADLNAIKDLLGHANLAATQVYTHNSFEQLKKVYNQAHPRAEKQEN